MLLPEKPVKQEQQQWLSVLNGGEGRHVAGVWMFGVHMCAPNAYVRQTCILTRESGRLRFTFVAPSHSPPARAPLPTHPDKLFQERAPESPSPKLTLPCFKRTPFVSPGPHPCLWHVAIQALLPPLLPPRTLPCSIHPVAPLTPSTPTNHAKSVATRALQSNAWTNGRGNTAGGLHPSTRRRPLRINKKAHLSGTSPATRAALPASCLRAAPPQAAGPRAQTGSWHGAHAASS
eukprot:190119-Chlamydomonas_euryale.AAC.4